MALVDGELSFEAGELDRAEQLLAEARGTPRPGPAGMGDRGYSLGLSARVASRRGDAALVSAHITELAEVIGQVEANRQNNFCDAWHGALTAACRSGLTAADVLGLEGLLKVPLVPVGNDGDPGWPDHLRGAVAELEGNYDEAISRYRASISHPLWRRSVPAKGDALIGIARCLLRKGDHAGALVSANEAAELLEHWPSWRRDEANSLVRRLGATGTPSKEGELTAREREVAVLVAEGLTNGEIGKRLFISTKTASVHVSSILRKLVMTNRSEIAAWAVRNGLQDQSGKLINGAETKRSS
jgi:DNA-binding CsgD family transcriptional regulator